MAKSMVNRGDWTVAMVQCLKSLLEMRQQDIVDRLSIPRDSISVRRQKALSFGEEIRLSDVTD